MATNKADVQTQINIINDGGLNTAAELRSVLGTNADSLLEAIYADRVTDSQATATITTANADINYNIHIYKVGSNIVLSGKFTVVNTLPGFTVPTLFSFSDTKWSCISQFYYGIAIGTGNYDNVTLFINGNDLKTNNSLLAGEEYSFTLTYKALN